MRDWPPDGPSSRSPNSAPFALPRCRSAQARQLRKPRCPWVLALSCRTVAVRHGSISGDNAFIFLSAIPLLGGDGIKGQVQPELQARRHLLKSNSVVVFTNRTKLTMSTLSFEALVTLILGVPSLIIALLSWWETRRARFEARGMHNPPLI